MTRLEVGLWAVFTTLVILLAAGSTRPRGDSGEYVLMAAAFAIHATPEIRDEDAAWVGQKERRLTRLMNRVRAGMKAEEPVLLGSIHRSPGGRYFSFHFWFYSLLAAPLLFASHFAGASPLYGLTLTNACLVVGAVWYASRGLSSARRALLASMFLVAGTTYYVAWTGPEVLTATALLVSCFAALRGDLGLALLTTGAGATQNPGAFAGSVFALGTFFLVRRGWHSGLGLRARRGTLDARTVALAVAGGALAISPYVFFEVVFGVPSLIARYTTDPSLASFERLFSLFFDLNQGMVVGVPGVMLGLVAAAVLLAGVPSRGRTHGGLLGGLALLTTVLAVIPSLATHNWNSGCAVFMRYAYWAAVPLLVAFLDLLARLPARRAIGVGFAAASVQALALDAHGFTGDRVSYTRHGAIAELALRRSPGLYNPVPEIFLERTLRRESSPAQHPVVAWPSHGTPRKVLLADGATPEVPSICDGGSFESASEVRTTGGRYLNGPFRCEPAR